MKRITLPWFLLVPVTLCAQPTPTVLLSPAPAEWQKARWSAGVPGPESVAVVTNGRTLLLKEGALEITTLRVGNNDAGGTVQMTGGDLRTSATIQLGTAGAGRSQFTQRAGNVAATRIQLASNNSAEARASYGIAGGRIEFTHLDVGTVGAGVFSVLGSAVERVSGMNIFLAGGTAGALEFILDHQGVTPVLLSGRVEIGPASHLRINGARYTGTATQLPLLTGRITGRFPPDHVVFLGFPEHLAPVLEYTRDGLRLRLDPATPAAPSPDPETP